MDWVVRVITNDNQIKDVILRDYNYSSDAQTAAICQTNAKSVITCSRYFGSDYIDETSQTSDSPYSSSDRPEWMVFLGVFLLVGIPICGILWLIHPIICFMFGGLATWLYIKTID